MANSVFFKTLSKSVYTSNMIKGGGQGGLKRKKILTPSICGKTAHVVTNLSSPKQCICFM